MEPVTQYLTLAVIAITIGLIALMSIDGVTIVEIVVYLISTGVGCLIGYGIISCCSIKHRDDKIHHKV